MQQCPICTTPLDDARVVCAACGEDLPLRVIVISEGSQGGGFALAQTNELPIMKEPLEDTISDQQNEEASL
jgi:hypothetical protein